MVLQRSMLGWKGLNCHRYMCIVLYIYIERSAIRCAKFGVVIFKASLLNWRRGVNLPWVYVHCSIYIYRSAMRCPKFGVAVLQVSILYWGVVCHGYLCIVLYMKLMWCHGFAEIYAQLEGGQSAIGICALFYIYI